MLIYKFKNTQNCYTIMAVGHYTRPQEFKCRLGGGRGGHGCPLKAGRSRISMKRENTDKRVLLINDLCGYGKVALSAMIPIFSYYGLPLYTLPTALVSNTLDYHDFTIQDTTEYLKKTLSIWKNLNFKFDVISTGFIVTEEQMKTISEFCNEESEKGVLVFNDPIMGDDGSLYDGVPEKTVKYMRGLVSCAHVTMPNYTEACYLTGRKCNKDADIGRKEASDIISDIRSIGAKSVVVTSCIIDGGKCVAGYDENKDENFFIPYEEIPVRFPGTGDIFSSVIIGNTIRGNDLKTSTARAMEVIREMILENKDQEDTRRGLPIEQCLRILD